MGKIKTAKQILKIARKANKKTGKGMISSVKSVLNAKKAGIPLNQYMRYQVYLKTEDQYEGVIKQIEIDNELIKDLREASGGKLTVAEARRLMKKMRRAGVSLYWAKKFSIWEAPDEEIKELGQVIKDNAAKKKKNTVWQNRVIVEKAGCDYEEANRRREAIKAKGYRWWLFITRAYYMMSAEEIMAMPKYVPVKVDEEEKRMKAEKREKQLNAISETMGWTRRKTEYEFFKAKLYTGARLNEWYACQMYKYDIEKQKTFVTHEIWQKLYLRHCDYAENHIYFRRKDNFNKKFSEYIKRGWALVEELSLDEFKEFVRGQKAIMYKPLNLACGIGITKYEISENEDEVEALYNSLVENGSGIIETLIVQHPEMSKINPSSVNSIRVQTFREGDKLNIINATLRTGGSADKCVDNFSNGGFIANVDVKTGHVITDGINKQGEIREFHPVSGLRFKDMVIPCWDKAIEMLNKTAFIVDKVPYLGWDVVINDDETVQLIEANHDGDATLHQFCASIDGVGIRDTIDKYIWFEEDGEEGKVI